MTNSTLFKLHSLLQNRNFDAFLLSTKDEFLNEYTPDNLNRLKWLTNFSGSNGYALIKADGSKSIFFTDGRYTTQARYELDIDQFEIYDISQKNLIEYLQESPTLKNIAFYSFAHTINEVQNYQKNCPQQNFIGISNHIIDELWQRDSQIKSDAFILKEEFSGQSASEKIEIIVEHMKQHNAKIQILTKPESICWLLNLRAHDLQHTPLLLSYAIIYDTNQIFLFTNNQLNENILDYLSNLNIKNKLISNLDHFCSQLNPKDIIAIDYTQSNHFFLDIFKKHHLSSIKHLTDYCIILKAQKNLIEQDGFRKAHLVDGLAITKFLYWISQQGTSLDSHNLTEQSACDQLLFFRNQHPDFVCSSFKTISSFASNGAIIHYEVNSQSNKKIQGNSLYLVDSGGQYLYGTTDTTRTILIGKATEEQKLFFTLTLKGHIALDSAIFPQGTTGAQLDVLARQYLWSYNQNYAHGTGHGVGHFLSVHEGPHNIAAPSRNHTPLMEGMIVSNEPGFYKVNEYGIRIENLLLVQKNNHGFLYFETLTLAPIDHSLVLFSLLTPQEKEWLIHYHQKILSLLSPSLNHNEKNWIVEILETYQNAI